MKYLCILLLDGERRSVQPPTLAEGRGARHTIKNALLLLQDTLIVSFIIKRRADRLHFVFLFVLFVDYGACANIVFFLFFSIFDSCPFTYMVYVCLV